MPITKINFSPGSHAALFSLLQDRDENVASLAMEQILQSNDFDKLMRNYQDSSDSLVRRRVHQMGNIARRRQLLEQLLGRMKDSGGDDLWHEMMAIDRLYDPQNSFNYLGEMTNELIRELKPRRGGTVTMAKFMREQNFSVPSQNWFDIGNFLLGDVLESRVGAVPLLCVITQHIGTFRNWRSRICLHNGRFCLLDQNKILLDPGDGWTVKKKVSAEDYHVCSTKEVMLIMVSQLFSLSVINWEPWDIHLFTKILSALHQIDPEQLPYPLGSHLSPISKHPEISEQ